MALFPSPDASSNTGYDVAVRLSLVVLAVTGTTVGW